MPRIIISEPLPLSTKLGEAVTVKLEGCEPGAELKKRVEQIGWVLRAVPSGNNPHGWSVTLQPNTKWNKDRKKELQTVFESYTLVPSKP